MQSFIDIVDLSVGVFAALFDACHATALALAQSVARAELHVVHRRSPPDAATHAEPIAG